MTFTTLLPYLLMGGAVTAAVAVIVSSNPVQAVFSLVLVFTRCSGLRLTLGREFRCLVFLRVYVGAIAVLFLFVVRMLNVQAQSHGVLALDRRMTRPMGVVVALTFIAQRASTLANGLGGVPATAPATAPAPGPDSGHRLWVEVRDSLIPVRTLGQTLYTHYVSAFLVAGFVLLTARVVAVSLVLGLPTGASVETRRQQASQQRSRGRSGAIFLVHGPMEK